MRHHDAGTDAGRRHGAGAHTGLSLRKPRSPRIVRKTSIRGRHEPPASNSDQGVVCAGHRLFSTAINNNHESPPNRRRLPLVRRARPVTAGVGVPHFGDMIISANDDPGLQEPVPGSVRPCWLAVCQACPSRAQEQLASAVRCFGQAHQGASSPGPDDRRPRQQIGNTRAESGPIEPTSPNHEKRV